MARDSIEREIAKKFPVRFWWFLFIHAFFLGSVFMIVFSFSSVSCLRYLNSSPYFPVLLSFRVLKFQE